MVTTATIYDFGEALTKVREGDERRRERRIARLEEELAYEAQGNDFSGYGRILCLVCDGPLRDHEIGDCYYIPEQLIERERNQI